jgi:DNA-binding protein YbaB
MFDKIKDLMKFRTQMAEIKKKLDDVVIEKTSAGDLIKIFISGSQEIRDVRIIGNLQSVTNAQLENILKDLVNDAIKSSQSEAAARMGQISDISQGEA